MKQSQQQQQQQTQQPLAQSYAPAAAPDMLSPLNMDVGPNVDFESMYTKLQASGQGICPVVPATQFEFAASVRSSAGPSLSAKPSIGSGEARAAPITAFGPVPDPIGQETPLDHMEADTAAAHPPGPILSDRCTPALSHVTSAHVCDSYAQPMAQFCCPSCVAVKAWWAFGQLFRLLLPVCIHHHACSRNKIIQLPPSSWWEMRQLRHMSTTMVTKKGAEAPAVAAAVGAAPTATVWLVSRGGRI